MRCKKGDLAEIIRGSFGATGPNIGKIVEVCDFVCTDTTHGPVWLVKSRTLDLVTEYGGVGDNLHCADDWLRPIPMPDNSRKVQEKTLETIH